ncbi:MAG: NAD(+) synthase [Halobacteriota archaeon]
MTNSIADPIATIRDDSDAVRDECASFIRSTVADADADGVVVGLSGGLDSTVVATLAVEALGPERVYGLILPSSKIGSRSAQDAEAIAEALEIEADTIHLQPLLMCFAGMAPSHTDLHGDPIARGNLVARLRMAMVYLAANTMKRLVVGSTTRTELLLGSFSKHGDGAADLLPLGGLYRTEIEALSEELDIPSFVVDPPLMAGFYPGQSDRHDIDAPQETIDTVLCRLTEGDDPDRISSEFDIEAEIVERIRRYHRTTKHKRRLPPIGPKSRRA